MFNRNFTFSISDIFTFAILAFYTLTLLLFWDRIESNYNYFIQNIGLAFYIILINYFISVKKELKILKILHKISLMPIVFLIYSQVHALVPAVNPKLYDWLMIQWDRAIFGGDPTNMLFQFSNPVLTEVLQFSYMTFFFMPLLHTLEHYKNGKMKEFELVAGAIVFSFYLSYVMYFIFPTIGPRFTLHVFSMLNVELPGLWLTEFFRQAVNSGAGLSAGHPDPISIVNRDCMPSGHTWISIVNVYLAFRYQSKLKYIFLVFSTLLIFSTIYLRYHYVVDVLAGAIFAIICIIIEPIIVRFIINRQICKL